MGARRRSASEKDGQKDGGYMVSLSLRVYLVTVLVVCAAGIYIQLPTEMLLLHLPCMGMVALLRAAVGFAFPRIYPDRDQGVRAKVVDQFVQLWFHVWLVVLGLRAVWCNSVFGHSWLHDTFAVWEPSPKLRVADRSIQLTYSAEMSLYLYCSVIQAFFAPANKDFLEMAVHHIATLLLCGGSFLQHYFGIGILVMLVHDTTDIPIDLLKLSHTLRMERATAAAFSVVMITWPIVRLYLFPRYVVASAFRAWSMCTDGWIPGVFCWTLTLLVLLHIYWYALFCRLAWRLAQGKKPSQAGDIYDKQTDAAESAECRQPVAAKQTKTD